MSQSSNRHDAEIAVKPTVALLPCAELIEDFLDHIGISFETFCKEFVGSWMFGYINALQTVGVRTVLVCISADVTQPSRFTHAPTGATICVLPAPRLYRAYRRFRRGMLNSVGTSEETIRENLNNIDSQKSLSFWLLRTLKNTFKSFWSYLSTPLGTLRRELRSLDCAAIICQEYEYPRFDACTILAWFMRLPVFATFQGGDKIQSFLEYLPRLLAFRVCTGLIIATQTEVGRVQERYRVPKDKIACIFNPVDAASWYAINQSEARTALGIPHSARVVVYHGRIDIYRKGLDILLDAWEKICRDRPEKDLRLLLVGTGPDADKLRQRITAMQLKGVMWLDKFVSDRSVMQRYLSAADVYTLPSRQEGFPVAPIEAMSCGLPVVAADAPGVRDILEGGEISGGLVVPREDATALAEAIGRVLDDEAWGRELGLRAQCRADCFSPEVVGKQLRDVLLNPSLQKRSNITNLSHASQ